MPVTLSRETVMRRGSSTDSWMLDASAASLSITAARGWWVGWSVGLRRPAAETASQALTAIGEAITIAEFSFSTAPHTDGAS
jgi:hypothetical protein